MKYFIPFFLLFLSLNQGQAQELNCTFSVNYERVTNADPKIFGTLKKQVNEFLNNTKWTNKIYAANEKIECSFFLNISSYNSGNFEATLQVQTSRPIFNSTYSSPILNLNDNEVSFRYIEYENLIYDPNNYTSNLISVLAFYANVIVGMDSDSYSELGGTAAFEIAQNISNLAQSSGYNGWSPSDAKNNNRFFLINDMLSSTFEPFRKAIYAYHIKGLDLMAADTKKAKEGIIDAINILAQLQNVRPNALLTRTFFDAKSDEIVQVFTGGPMLNVTNFKATLSRISPLNNTKWNTIR